MIQRTRKGSGQRLYTRIKKIDISNTLLPKAKNLPFKLEEGKRRLVPTAYVTKMKVALL